VLLWIKVRRDSQTLPASKSTQLLFEPFIEAGGSGTGRWTLEETAGVKLAPIGQLTNGKIGQVCNAKTRQMPDASWGVFIYSIIQT
jgi:hypothetical protein